MTSARPRSRPADPPGAAAPSGPDALGLVLFPPEATATGRFRLALRALRGHGLHPVRFAWADVRPATLWELYQRDTLDIDPLEMELTDLQFGLGPSLACVLRAGPEYRDPRSAAALLTELKGASDPALADPAGLRRGMGAENSILKFLHASDSSAHTLREAALFFPDAGDGTEDADDAEVPPAPPELVPRATVSVFDALARLKGRLADAAPSLRDPELHALLREEAEIALAWPSGPDAGPALHRLAAAQRARVAAVRAGDDPAAEAFHALAGFHAGPPDVCGVLDALRALGVEADAWDTLILRAQQFHGALPLAPGAAPPVPRGGKAP